MSKTMFLQQQARRILANNSNRSFLLRRFYNTDLENCRKQQGASPFQVNPSYVRGLINNLRHTNEFSNPLKAETVFGLEEAEKFFEIIPENMKDYSVYNTLLRSYTRSEETLDKAEFTFEKMRDLGFLLNKPPSPMISLYGEERDKIVTMEEAYVREEGSIEMYGDMQSEVYHFGAEGNKPSQDQKKKKGKNKSKVVEIRKQNIKFLKQHRGRIKGRSSRGNNICFGTYALQTLEPAWITSRQLEAGRRAMLRTLQRGGKIWVRVIPDKSVTRRATEVRMGRGKGPVECWVAVVKPGRIIYEIGGVPESIARQAISIAASKMPIKTKFIMSG